MSMDEQELGRLLVQAGILTAEKYGELLALGKDRNKDIRQTLLDEAIMTGEELGMITGIQQEVSFLEINQHRTEQKALNHISREVAEDLGVIPVKIIDGVLIVAVPDPTDADLMDEIRTKAGMPIKLVQADPMEITNSIDLNYKTGGGDIDKEVSAKLAMALEAEVKRMKAQGKQDMAADSPIAHLVNMLVTQAANYKASDIHIEPQEDRLRVRFRIDGVLHDVLSLPLDVHSPLVSRMKIMGGMNIADRRRPQDGEFSVDIGNDRIIDIRAATIDTVHGEKMILRMLERSVELLDLTEIGFLVHDLEIFLDLISLPYGMILVAGPTGSGKTTTLYSAIGQINQHEKNIMTIEDPVEYRFGNISQVQTNDQAGMTFASGLRALMRLDPDVILIGEIRDAETAGIATRAALTGHLVLSSIHARDSVGAIYRLMDFGIEPELIASSLSGVLSQRLVRRVCPQCRGSFPAPVADQVLYETEMREKRREFLYGRGCSACADTGYLGRTAVHELLTITEELRRLIIDDADSAELRAQAIKDGMVPMWRNGMLNVRSGQTTVYELNRAISENRPSRLSRPKSSGVPVRDLSEEFQRLRREVHSEAIRLKQQLLEFSKEAQDEAQRLGEEMGESSSEETDAISPTEVDKSSRDEELTLDTYLNGEVRIVVQPPVDPGLLLKINQILRELPGAAVLEFAGSWDGGVSILLSLSRPVPILTSLRRIEGVKEAIVTERDHTFLEEDELVDEIREFLTDANKPPPKGRLATVPPGTSLTNVSVTPESDKNS